MSALVGFWLFTNACQVGLSHEARLESLVNRLTKKYASRAQARTATAGVEARGTNNYNIVISNTPTQSMSVALDQDGTDFSYFASVNFGSKNKALYLLMDTGASSTWVMGSSCTTEACAQHNSFGPSDSTTYQSTTNPFAINYGSGVVNGTYASDSVSFAGMSFSLDFGSAAYTSNDFLSFPMDGIMGLALNNGSVPNIMQTIKSAKILSSNIFGVNINRNSDGLKNGEVTFGAIDTTKYTGSLTYTSVASGSAGDWVIPVDDVGFKGTKAGATGRDAYIDTGTSFVFIPAADAAKLYANIPGSVLSSDGTSYSVPCSTTDSIQFYFSGVAYSVQAKDWVGGQSGSSSLCTSNIYARSLVGDNAWLLGDTFLKNVYAVFDIDQNRIGMWLCLPRLNVINSETGFGVKAQSSATSTVSSSGKIVLSSLISFPYLTIIPSTLYKLKRACDYQYHAGHKFHHQSYFYKPISCHNHEF